jgi:beta-xylosidase
MNGHHTKCVRQTTALYNKLGVAIILAASTLLLGQSKPVAGPPPLSSVWNPDNGDGTYRNPVLYADYSDPDVLRVGDDFYMVASSFDAVPGLPILHSKDLVHWELIGHALDQQPPIDVYRAPQHGNGAWAPSLRFHAGQFFIFYPDPNYGIYMVKAPSIHGPWSEPLLIKAAKGWIDPCPLWDDDGKAYLLNGLAASRSGVKTALVLSRMSPDGAKLLDSGALIIDGHSQDPTLEGPKIYKRHGYYYVFAPAGGVPKGWQLVYRSKSIYGPYERRVVLAQGSTDINGPHQGAWVDTPLGEDWFLHFQDLGPYGRVVRLEPMHWGSDDWPVIGVHPSPEGTGEPVANFTKPKIRGVAPFYTPADSDEFNAPSLGLQWQWQANPEANWAFPAPNLGALRLINIPVSSADVNLWNVPNILLQKFPAPEFTVTAKLRFTPRLKGEQTGLVILGKSYSAIVIQNTAEGLVLKQVTRQNADRGEQSVESPSVSLQGDTFYLRSHVDKNAMAAFSYSLDGATFHSIGTAFHSTVGAWIGAKIGIFAIGVPSQNEFGYADYDWIHFEH